MKQALALIALLAFLAGCATTPTKTAYRTEGTIITTVDTAMRAWADWVNAGHATQSQVDTVKGAYLKYEAAQHVARVATLAYLNAATTDNANSLQIALQAVGDAAGPVINLVQQFTHL